jgi:oligosaccharide repeat unit polymerase
VWILVWFAWIIGSKQPGLVFASCGIVALGGWFVLRDAWHGCLDFFESKNLFLVFFSLYALPLPFLGLLGGSIDSTEFEDWALTRAAYLSFLGLFIFLLAYRSAVGAKVAMMFGVPRKVAPERLRNVTLALIGMVLIWFQLFLSRIGGLWAYLSAGYVSLYQIEEGLEHYSYSMNVFPACLLLLYHNGVRTKSRIWWAFTILAFLGVALLFLTVGKRRLLLTILLGVMIYHHYAVSRLRLGRAVALLVVAAVSASGIGLIRALPADELLSAEVLRWAADMPKTELFYVFLGHGEFASTFSTFPHMIEEISNGRPYAYGRSYLETPLILVPRAFYPDRPPTGAQWYVETFYPDVAANLGGKAFFFMTEAYWNLGVLGIIVVMLLCGVAFRSAYELLRRSKYAPEAALVYASLMSQVPTALRVDFATALKGAVLATVPFIVLVLWYSSRGESLRKESPIS